MTQGDNKNVLVIDDQESIREDFRKILGAGPADDTELSSARSAFFGEEDEETAGTTFSLTFASQGDVGVRVLREAVEEGRRFAMAFVDVRMPPGPDGLQTIHQLWAIDPDLEVVICTAYSDYSFEDIVATLGETDRLLILKKPFDPVEVRQITCALTEKWNVIQRERSRIAELSEANQRAEAASRAKSEFLANMSHEIRTPMNAILGYIDLLTDPDSTASERAEYGETIRRSGRHLLTILNDVLDISRIEAGRMVIEAEEFDPVEVAREVVRLLGTQAAEKDLTIGLEVVGRVPARIRADVVRVRQVLMNLMGNAVKFTPEGSVRLRLRTREPEDRDGTAYLVCEVIDTGIGIAEEDRKRLFEPFSQADTSLTRRAGGTGLGLTISQRLARMMGGDLRLADGSGPGSRFIFELPVGPPSRIEWRSEASPPEAAEAAAENDFGPLNARVLVVEDVRVNQALISAVLRRAGATVELADDGRAGRDAVLAARDAGRPFDIVLMDMQMPVLDGYSATRELRAAGVDLPIVALTAHAMSGDRDRCLEAGCSSYLTKPIDRRELLRTCRELLRPPDPPAALPGESGESTRVRRD